MTRQWKLLGIAILCMTIAAVLTWLWLKRGGVREGLADYVELLKVQDTDEVRALIEKVMNPQPDEDLPIKFPRDISMYALAKYARNPENARKALLESYDVIQVEMSTSTPVDHMVKWNKDPKKESCEQVAALKTTLTTHLTQLRAQMADLSGTQLTMISLRDENMGMQKKFEKQCESNLTKDCEILASQEEALFPLVPQYDAINEELLEKEIDISETIDILNDVSTLIGCSTSTAGFDAARDVGFIDTDALRTKLEELSPYYLSPGTIQYVSRYLSTSEAAQSTLSSASEITGNMSAVVGNINALLRPRM